MAAPTGDSFRDVEVPVAQYVDDQGNPVSADKVTARGLLIEAKRVFEPYERASWQRAAMNERYLNGDQWGAYNYQSNEFVFDDWPVELPRVNRNVLRNLQLTWQSRVTGKDPAVKAWGGESSANDVNSAEVANKLIAAWRQQDDHRRMISRAAWTCGAQSCVGLWTTWDTTKGPMGMDGRPLGDIDVTPLAVFDWGTDGSENIEDSEYCYVRRWLTADVAKELMMKAGITTPPNLQPARSIWGENRSLAECYYLYYKRSTRIPEGHYSIHVGGHVVESGPFPYDHNELPLVIWKCNDKPDSPHGGTHVDDAVPLQNGLNRLHASLAKLTYRSADWVKVIGDPSIIAEWDAEGQKIECKDPAMIAAVRIVSPPPPPPLLLSQIEEHERMITVVFGINEAVSGGDSGTRSSNAKHLLYISELDAQKLAPTIAMRDHALMRMYRQMLMLCQQYVAVPRMVRLIGDAGLPSILQFVGADLKGVDVYLEPAPGVDMLKTAQALAEEQDVVAGFEDPARGKELRRTGQDATALETITRKAVNDQVKSALGGFAVQPDASLVPGTAIQVILDAMEQNASMGPDRLAGLTQLLNAYREMAQQQAQMGQAQPPKEAPKAEAKKESIV